MSAPDPPAFPDSLRSKPEFPRPKPPPIITKKTIEGDVPHHEKRRHSKEKSKEKRSSKSHKKNQNISIKSPSDGNFNIVIRRGYYIFVNSGIERSASNFC
jgi:hypothetical protein